VPTHRDASLDDEKRVLGRRAGLKIAHVKAVDLTEVSFNTAGLRLGYIW
jgi:hypothetical protein